MLQTDDIRQRHGLAQRHSTVGLAPPKYYRVGEITAHFGLSRQTIHNYTTMGLIAESRWTPGGHRLYDASVFGRVAAILDMKDRGLTMQEIQDHMSARTG
jgi:DNA-binding transcriptional MerR regulator